MKYTTIQKFGVSNIDQIDSKDIFQMQSVLRTQSTLTGEKSKSTLL